MRAGGAGARMWGLRGAEGSAYADGTPVGWQGLERWILIQWWRWGRGKSWWPAGIQGVARGQQGEWPRTLVHPVAPAVPGVSQESTARGQPGELTRRLLGSGCWSPQTICAPPGTWRSVLGTCVGPGSQEPQHRCALWLQ